MQASSFDKNCALLFNSNGKKLKTFNLNEYVAFVFNGSWHFGKLVYNNKEELEFKINKLHFCNTTNKYSFQENVITLTIPYPHILCKISFKTFKKKVQVNSYQLPTVQLEKITNNYKMYTDETFNKKKVIKSKICFQ